MQYSCLYDSAESFVPAKSESQVVGEIAFGQSVCRIFWFLICWKLFESPCTSWLVMLNLFPLNVILKEKPLHWFSMKIHWFNFKKQFLEYISLNSLMVLIFVFRVDVLMKLCVLKHILDG